MQQGSDGETGSAVVAKPPAIRIVQWLVPPLLLAAAIMMGDRLLFSPDSWTLYELSRSIFTDFYHVNHLRSFESASYQSAAFPPLWPVLLAGLNSVLDAGPRLAFYLALFSFIPFALFSEWLGRRLFAAAGVGLAAALLAWTHFGYWEELIAGRTIPLQMLLYAALAWVVARGPLSFSSAALAGLLAGLSALNRFDALALALAMPIALLLLRPSASALAGYVLALGLTLSPWLYYSMTELGRVFASESGSVALAADPTAFVTDWWPRPTYSLFDDPAGWGKKVATNLSYLPAQLVLSPARTGIAAFALVIGLVGVATLRHRQVRQALRPRAMVATFWHRYRPALVMLLALAALLPSYVLTGFFDARYFVPLWWLAALILIGVLIGALPPERRGRVGALAAALALALAVLVTITRSLAVEQQVEFPGRDQDRVMVDCLPSDPRSTAVLHHDDTEAARLAALYGWRTLLVPRNLDRLTGPELRQFLETFEVRIVAFSKADQQAAFRGEVDLLPIPGCPKGWFIRR